MTPEERFKVIARNCEDIVTEDEQEAVQAARQYQKRIDIFGKISILTKERRTLQWQKW